MSSLTAPLNTFRHFVAASPPSCPHLLDLSRFVFTRPYPVCHPAIKPNGRIHSVSPPRQFLGTWYEVAMATTNPTLHQTHQGTPMSKLVVEDNQGNMTAIQTAVRFVRGGEKASECI